MTQTERVQQEILDELAELRQLVRRMESSLAKMHSQHDRRLRLFDELLNEGRAGEEWKTGPADDK